MIPKKPTLTAARKEWLASLQPGSAPYIWRDHDGWNTCKVINVGGRIAVKVDGTLSFLSDAILARGSGLATEHGKLSAAIFPNIDPDARAAHQADQFRRSLREVEWRGVDDSTVQRIADLLRLDIGKEPRP